MPDRIYGEFQWAGFKIPTAAKSQVSNDGTNAYAVSVVTVDTSGNPTGGGSGALASQVQGNVASGASDTGTNPVKTGGVFNTAQPTVTTGQRVDAQYTNRGEALVSLSQAGVAASINNGASTLAITTAALAVRGLSYNYDGSQLNITRDATTANGTTGTGLQGVGALGFDGTNYQRLITQTAGANPSSLNVQALVTRAQLSIFDGTNGSLARDSNSSNATTGTGLLGTGILGFDGTNYRRASIDASGLVVESALNASQWNYPGVTGGITSTADTTMMTASASSRNYVKSFQFFNSSAVASEIVIKDGTTTVLWRGRAPASMLNSTVITFDPPLKGSQNTAMVVAMITTATATVVSAQGWQGA